MLDIDLVRKNPETVKEALEKRQSEIRIEEVVKLDKEWKQAKELEESLRAERNKITGEIKLAKQQGKKIGSLMEKAKEIPKKLFEAQKKTKNAFEKRNYLIERLPNILHESVPPGGEKNYKVVKEHGKKPKLGFNEKHHHSLGAALDMLDLPRAAKIAGAGFYLLKGDLARLERALINYFLEFHHKNGLVELFPPYLVNEKTAFGTGNLPKFEEDLYKTTEGLYLLPTAEVPVTNIYANETLQEKDLPKKFCSYTACFRTEAGQHGSDTPGIFRLHQFDKVEMVYICRQEDSRDLLEEMRSYGEKLLEELGLHYRTIILAGGDTGIASAKTYDLEAYAPAMDKYLEVSSVSNCTDFQARRMNTKYVSKKGERKFVHTLNGSGLATPRLLISLMETYQTKEGSIKIPKVLQKYMGGQKEIKKQ